MRRSTELNDAELDEFERLIEVPDRDLLAWVTGERSRSRRSYDTPLFRRVARFHAHRGEAVTADWRDPRPNCWRPAGR